MGDNESVLEIGSDTDIGIDLIMLVLEGKKVIIGKDCMFSSNITIMNSDAHSIISLDENERLNFSKDINIGDHVWIGAGVTILKGTDIQDNTIIGSRSLLTNKLYQNNCVYAGSPAELRRENVNWLRERI